MKRRRVFRAAAVAAAAGLLGVGALPTMRLLAYGDSITWGLGASRPERAYAAIVARRLGRSLDNRAVSGSYCQDHVEALTRTTFADGDLVIWLTGYNDMRGGTAIAAYADTLAAGLAAVSVPVLLGNCLRMTAEGYAQRLGPFGSDERVAAFNVAIATVAARFPLVRLVDVAAVYDPANNCDLVHPNDRGYEQITGAFLPWRQYLPV